MTIRTNKKGPNNRGESKLKALLRSIWLGIWNDVRTFVDTCYACFDQNNVYSSLFTVTYIV